MLPLTAVAGPFEKFVEARPSFTLPDSVTEDCASATPGRAAATASARSDFFIDKSPKFLESIDSLHAAETPPSELVQAIPGQVPEYFDQNSR